jgi:TonB-dependent receptor
MNLKRKPSLVHLLAGASAVAMGASAPLAMAQDATSDEDAAEAVPQDEGNVIVVSGIRASLRESMNIKREGQGVVDAISAEDIGKFPDTNLAESLQRITGVSIERTNGEGTNVTVRGFGADYNLVTLNGRQMPTSTLGDGASAPSSRSFDFGNLASEAVAAVEVYKTGRATIPSGGIGSTINIRTPRPLDDPGFKGSIGVKGVYDTSQNGDTDVTPEVSGILSSTFMDDRIGVALTGSYQKRNSSFNQFFSEFRDGYLGCGSGFENEWGAIPCDPGNDWRGNYDLQENRPGADDVYAVPQNGSYNITDVSRERINGQAVLQYEVADGLTATIDYTFSQNTVEARQSSVGIWFNHVTTASSYTDGPVTSPNFYSENFGDAPSDLSYSGSLTANRSINKSLGFNLEWEAPGGLTWVFDYHNSSAESKPTNDYGSSMSVGTAVYGLLEQKIDYTTYLPIISYVNAPGVDSNDPAARFATGNSFRNAYFRDDIEQAQLSGHWEADLGFLDSLDFGVAYTENKVKSAYGFIQNDTWGGVGTAADIPDDIFYEINIPEAFKGMEGANSPDIIQSFYGFDLERMVDILEGQFGICSNPATGTPISGTCLAVQDTDRRITEKTIAPYAEANFTFDVGAGEAQLITGLRYENTTVDSSALVPIPTGTQWVAANEFNLTYAPGAFARQKGNYDFWLPNVDLKVEPVNDVIVRASYSHTIARPTYAQLQGGRTFDALFRVGGGFANQGNPGLLPYKSENFDVSAEWYYGPESYLSVGYFRKNVKNFIGSVTSTITVDGTEQPFTTPLYDPYNGPRADAARAALGQDAPLDDIRAYIIANYPDSVVDLGNGQFGIVGLPEDALVDFQLTTPINNDQTGTIDGWEFALQHNFWDTGFGVILNYTIVDGDAKFDNTLPYTATQFALVGLSDSANAVLFYDKGPLQARAAWNWRDEYLAGYGNNPFYRDEYWQIDASISYEFDMGLTIFAEAINLTGEDLKGHRRGDNTTFFSYRGAPRYAGGVRFSF